jgi:uncharacterized membrane protein
MKQLFMPGQAGAVMDLSISIVKSLSRAADQTAAMAATGET